MFPSVLGVVGVSLEVERLAAPYNRTLGYTTRASWKVIFRGYIGVEDVDTSFVLR